MYTSIWLNVEPTMQKNGQIKITARIRAKVVARIALKRKRPIFDLMPSPELEGLLCVAPVVVIRPPPVPA
jgi:hypothetical protein